MRFHTIHTGNFKLDGGPCLGWCQATLVQDQPGGQPEFVHVGHALPARRSRRPPGAHRLRHWGQAIGEILQPLPSARHGAQLGLEFASWILEEDITDVFLTHLHLTTWRCRAQGRWAIGPRLPNATFWSNDAHWDWAMNPNAREKASFLHDNLATLVGTRALQWWNAPDASHNAIYWKGGTSSLPTATQKAK